jgi:hypothetical protein
MNKNMRYYLFAFILFFQFAAFAQKLPGVNGTTFDNDKFLNLGQTYNKTLCGLSYVQVSKMITTRYSPSGSGFPCALPINAPSLSSCYVIDKAYLYWTVSYKTGSSTTPIVSFTSPLNITANYPGQMIGQAGDKNWYVAGTRAFRADVTPAITGNGTYTINNIIGNTDWEVDGVTLIIIYRNTAASWKGTLILDDGIMTYCAGGGWGHFINGFTACDNGKNATSFLIVSDLQDNILPNPLSATLNGSAVTFPKNFWNFVEVNTTVTSGQSSSYSTGSGLTISNNGGDCFSVCVNGLYFQTTTCGTCASGLNVTAAATSTGNCNNGNSGTATATITGGNTSYSYYWIPGGQTTQTITGLGAGTYSVVVTDQDCNKDTAIVSVSSTGALTTSVTKTNLQCNGANNGSLTISASGGALPYTFLWSNGSTASALTALSANTYTVTVTDGNGCKSIVPVNISQPPPVSIAINAVDPTCNIANGAATVVLTGSPGPDTYLWSNGSTHEYAGQYSLPQKLAAGSYTVTVTDANGCAHTATTTIANVPLSAAFTQSPSGTVCTGTKVVFTSTGSVNNDVAHNWRIFPVSPANVTGSTANLSYTFLSVGTYSITDTVSIGACKTFSKSTVTVINCSGTTVSATATGVCSGSCATVTSTVTGGASPYVYSWSTGEMTQNINPCPLSSTTYTVKITDFGGATASSTVTVTVNPAVSVTVSSTPPCNGSTSGSVMATVSGGTANYSYSWSTGTSSITSSVTSQLSNLISTTYSVTITDSKGCTGTSSVTVQPELTVQYIKGATNCVGCGCKGWIMVAASNGVRPYSYSWPSLGGYDKRQMNKLCPGNYTIKVTDINGCSVNLIVNVP